MSYICNDCLEKYYDNIPSTFRNRKECLCCGKMTVVNEIHESLLRRKENENENN